MLRIAVCDDEEIFRDELEEILERYAAEKGIVAEVDSFDSGSGFTALGIEMLKYNIIFLDMNMSGLDGLMTAKIIRESCGEIFIVFVTGYADYSIQSFVVEPFRYIVKDKMSLKACVYECMDAIRKKMDYKPVWMEFPFNEERRKISLERLFYIESRLHKLEFHVMEDELRTYTMWASLKEIDDMLSKHGFLRIHKSFLVNIKHIKNVSRYKALLDNGTVLDIPRARYKEVEEKFILYKGEFK